MSSRHFSKGLSKHFLLSDGMTRLNRPIKYISAYQVMIFLPSSCGSSSQNIANEVLTPLIVELEYDAPMAKPSMKLWRASPMIIIQATGATFLFPLVYKLTYINNTRKIKFASSVFCLPKETPAWWENPVEDCLTTQPPN